MLTEKRLPALLLALLMCLSLAAPALASEEASDEAEEEAVITAEEDIADEPEAEEPAPAEDVPAADGAPAAPVLFAYPQPGGAAKRLAGVTVTPDEPDEYGSQPYAETYTYDDQGRLAYIDGGLGVGYAYSYDSEGRLTMITEEYPGRSVSFPYRYDDAGRLVCQKDRQHNTGVLAYEQREYTYDAYGYLTSVSVSSTFEDGPFSDPVTHPITNTIADGHLISSYTVDYGWGDPETYRYEFDSDGRMIADVQTYQQHYRNFLDTPCFTVCDHIEDHEVGYFLYTECLFYDTAGNIITSLTLGYDSTYPDGDPGTLSSPTTLETDADGYLVSAYDTNRGITYAFRYEDNPLYAAPQTTDLMPLVRALQYLVGSPGAAQPDLGQIKALGVRLVQAVVTLLEADIGG